MHELSIASSLLKTVEAESRRRPDARIRRLGLRLGELAGIDAAALTFAFSALVANTEWEPLALEIEWLRQRRACRQCGREFLVEDLRPDCPQCTSTETTFLSGDELEIAYLEVET